MQPAAAASRLTVLRMSSKNQLAHEASKYETPTFVSGWNLVRAKTACRAGQGPRQPADLSCRPTHSTR